MLTNETKRQAMQSGTTQLLGVTLCNNFYFYCFRYFSRFIPVILSLLLSGNAALAAATDADTPFVLRRFFGENLASASSGGNNGQSGGGESATAPSGYTVAFSSGFANLASQAAMSFSLSGGTAGATYNYTIDDAHPGTATITGTGTLSGTSQEWTGIDVSSLDDGMLTLGMTLSAGGLTGETVFTLSPIANGTTSWTRGSASVNHPASRRST